MKGIDISRKFYEEFGKPMLENEFPEIAGKVAVGLFGSGSECFGFDDEISKDHDFEAGFCIMLPPEEEVDRKTAFKLERAYAKLPKTFMGLTRSNLSPVGGNRRGVLRREDFFLEKVGRKDGLLSGNEWFSVSENFLAEATNGEVFKDDDGVFSATRDYLSSYPKDVRLKKLAGNLILASQAGQYNYERCLARGDFGGSALCLNEFVDKIINAIFLLSQKYRPYYKWTFKALSRLGRLSSLKTSLEFLITTDNSVENSKTKLGLISQISSEIIDELKRQDLTKAVCEDLSKHGYSVNDFISDPLLRNASALMAV